MLEISSGAFPPIFGSVLIDAIIGALIAFILIGVFVYLVDKE